MTNNELKQLINEVICESGELALINTNKLISKSATLEDFMKTLVGKKLKGLLDATSYARLYILNKYGVGSHPDENDVQANVAALMDNITAFINFRKLDGLGKHRDAWEKEQYSKPEYKEWLKQRTLAFKAYRDARDSNSSDAEELRKKYQTVVSSDPTLPDYRKMMTDKETLVNQFHNTPLTVDDVLPGPDDTESDKKRWIAVEKSFNKLKNMNESTLKQLVKEAIQELREEANTKELQKLGYKPTKSDVNETKGFRLHWNSPESHYMMKNGVMKNKSGINTRTVKYDDLVKIFPQSKDIVLKSLPPISQMNTGDIDYFTVDGEGDVVPLTHGDIGSGLD